MNRSEVQRLIKTWQSPFIVKIGDVTTLSTYEVEKITQQFIKDLAKCERDVLHNFMEDAGGAAGDLDECAWLLAKAWIADPVAVEKLVGDRYFQSMKQHALSRWERDKD